MTRVLLTAFEPFGHWQSNSSWQLVVELTKSLPPTPEVVTRLYPVDFEQIPKKLEEDLTGGFDYALHLGQSHKANGLELERFALNVGIDHEKDGNREFPLVPLGAAAYQTELPLQDWAEGMRQIGTPARVSHHAGEYCCNATFYHSQHLSRENGLGTQPLFIHVPITPQQATEAKHEWPSLEPARALTALRYLLDQLVKLGPRPKTNLA